MKIAARRRLAVGVVATTSALLAGVLIAPASTAAAGGLTISPNGVVNTQTVELTFDGTDADFTFGGEATFTRTAPVSSFVVDIDDASGDPSRDSDKGTATVNFTDMGAGLGTDGPADAGTYSVSADGTEVGVVGGGNDTCTSCFSVLSPGAVAVTSVAPNSVRPGQSSDISILGNNFERGSKVEFLAPGTDVVDTAINGNQAPNGTDTTPDTNGITTRTELKRRVTLAAGATAGVRDVRVTNLDGNTARCLGCFFVSGADLTGVSPTTSAFNDPGQAPTTLTFTGTAVASNPVPRLEFVGNPGSASRADLSVIGTNVRDVTATSVTADYDLSNAAPGSNAYQPQVRGDGGVVNSCTCRFTVIQRDTRMPTITSLDSDASTAGAQKTLAAGETKTFAVTGTNFSKGATLVFTPPAGLTVTAVQFVSPESFNATISAAGDAAAGDRDVQVRLTDGKTSATADNNLLTITPGASATPTPSSSTSASPSATPTASMAPGANGRYVGLASPVRELDTREGPNPTRKTREIVVDLSDKITDTSATAAVLNVTVTNATARGFLVAYPNGTTKPGTSNVNFEANQTQANEVVVRLPASRKVSLYVDSAAAHVITDLVGYFTTSTAAETGRVATASPSRALDTRGTDQRTRTGEVVLDLSGKIPSGSTDAILNVTVTETSARGFVTVFPTGTTRPRTSNVNFGRGQTQANEVITRVGTGNNAGKVSLFVDSARAAVIVDVVGAVLPGTVAGTQVFTPLQTQTRPLDTRRNSGARRSGNVDVQMPSSVPSDATGVVLNVTATNGTRPGFVTVFPTGSSNPGTSNVNFPTNLTQANEVVSRLGSNRSVTLFVGGGGSPQAHLIVDVVGYLTGSGASPAPSSSSSASASPGGGEDCDPISEALGLCTPAPSGSASPSASGSASATPSASASSSSTPSATPSASRSASPSASASTSPSASPSSAGNCIPTTDICG